ncbi:M4 family metallopeptidase [Phormidium tenue FACHB-886]|nr:M4 family metallopeptidase [Phormidium tenue FACHB-886]
MMDSIIKNGDDRQRDWALRTLRRSEQFRGRREAVGGLSMMAAAGIKRRTVFDARRSTTLPGTLVRAEGDPPSADPAVNEAYDGAGATYDLYAQVYGRNSIDDRGLQLDSSVHYSTNYDNAFWNGSQMVYGDGDGDLFQRFTRSLDVIGHELTHGVTQYEANLVYSGETGALNESFSDVFGILVKQRQLNQTADQADWLIGAGLFTAKVRGVGIRSLKAPGTAYDDPILGKDPQPANVRDYYQGVEDNGGVHINSGIPNHAFYLAAIEIGGFAWERAGRVWYLTLRDRLRSTANFRQAANATVAVAGALYGVNSKEHKAIRSAWQRVGVLPISTNPQQTNPQQ